MKRTINKLLATLTAGLLAVMAASAQDAGKIVTVDKTTHDFGDIYRGDGPVSCTFTFKNVSDKPILLLTAVSSCGCTDAEWTREPIQPGKTGTVSATYKNEDGPYPFDKTVTVYVSDIKKPFVLHIRGSVHEAAKPIKENYPLRIGNFGLKSLEIKAGNLSQREEKSGNVVVANVGSTPMKIEFENVSEGLSLQVFPNPVPARSTATISYTITASTERWGKNWYYATPVIDGRTFKAVGKMPAKEVPAGEEHYYTEDNPRIGIGKSEIAFWAVTKANFAQVSEKAKQEGANPNFTRSTESFGKVAAGTKTTVTFEYTNKGKKDSQFHKLDADCHNVTVREMEVTGPGKKGKIVIDLDTKGMPKGENIIALNLFTNSPLRPVISLQIVGTIQ